MDKVKIKNYPVRNPLFACWGCANVTAWTAAGRFKCSRYAKPQEVYSIRTFGICPFNGGFTLTGGTCDKVRVGQQKQQKRR